MDLALLKRLSRIQEKTPAASFAEFHGMES
jgi:hypothetical protein